MVRLASVTHPHRSVTSAKSPPSREGLLTVWRSRPTALPGPVIGLSNVTAIASFGAHTLALKADGTVWAWGDNHLGQLGHGTAGGNSPLPVQVTGLSNITKIVTGLAHSLARSTDGTVHAW